MQNQVDLPPVGTQASPPVRDERPASPPRVADAANGFRGAQYGLVPVDGDVEQGFNRQSREGAAGGLSSWLPRPRFTFRGAVTGVGFAALAYDVIQNGTLPTAIVNSSMVAATTLAATQLGGQPQQDLRLEHGQARQLEEALSEGGSWNGLTDEPQTYGECVEEQCQKAEDGQREAALPNHSISRSDLISKIGREEVSDHFSSWEGLEEENFFYQIEGDQLIEYYQDDRGEQRTPNRPFTLSFEQRASLMAQIPVELPSVCDNQYNATGYTLYVDAPDVVTPVCVGFLNGNQPVQQGGSNPTGGATGADTALGITGAVAGGCATLTAAGALCKVVSDQRNAKAVKKNKHEKANPGVSTVAKCVKAITGVEIDQRNPGIKYQLRNGINTELARLYKPLNESCEFSHKLNAVKRENFKGTKGILIEYLKSLGSNPDKVDHAINLVSYCLVISRAYQDGSSSPPTQSVIKNTSERLVLDCFTIVRSENPNQTILNALLMHANKDCFPNVTMDANLRMVRGFIDTQLSDLVERHPQPQPEPEPAPADDYPYTETTRLLARADRSQEVQQLPGPDQCELMASQRRSLTASNGTPPARAKNRAGTPRSRSPENRRSRRTPVGQSVEVERPRTTTPPSRSNSHTRIANGASTQEIQQVPAPQQLVVRANQSEGTRQHKKPAGNRQAVARNKPPALPTGGALNPG